MRKLNTNLINSKRDEMEYVTFRRKDGDVDGFKSGITNLVRLSRCELQCGNGERRRRTCTSHNIDIITWLAYVLVLITNIIT